jgi:hypothetical protein
MFTDVGSRALRVAVWPHGKLPSVFGFVYSRLRTALFQDLRKAWSKDFDAAVKTLQRDLSHMQAELAELRRAHQALVVKEWTQSREPLIATLDARMSLERIRAHIIAAVDRAAVCTDPTTHTVIENIFPSDFYDLVNAAIPPAELFPSRDPVKLDFHLDEHLVDAPLLTQRVWRFFDEAVVAGVLAPALHARFRDAVVDHYAETAGGDFGARAAEIPHRGFAGRLHLRRPGYHLKPHLDPKRVVITGLVYFARPGDSEAYGTQLFRVGRPFTSSTMGKFYPEDEGLPLELARTVPFRPNTLLAFVNSKAAHGATLPADAALRERYAYQFYVKPRDGDLKKLLLELPVESRRNWARFLDDPAEGAGSKVNALD